MSSRCRATPTPAAVAGLLERLARWLRTRDRAATERAVTGRPEWFHCPSPRRPHAEPRRLRGRCPHRS